MTDTASAPNEATGLSLLSLSAVAASAAPIPLSPSTRPTTEITLGAPSSFNGAALNGSYAAPTSVGISKHRRLSSTGKAKRRLSDARDAASRPSPATIQTAAATLSSLSTLSLSSPPTQNQVLPSSHGVPTSFTSASNSMASAIPIPASRSVSTSDGAPKSVLDDGSGNSSPPTGHVHDSGLTKGGKKRGTIFTCESCSKVYRHPSCLIKHRWEHSPQWREASKFVLSKHQQVQLLEAAAILSHLSPDSSGTSLPDDRSLWPSFLSGGALPTPVNGSAEPQPASYTGHPTSSSVPATSLLGTTNRAPSTGPRLHDYSIPSPSNGSAGLTQLRPGLLAVPTGAEADTPGSPAQGSHPVPVPLTDAYHQSTYGSVSGKSEPWGSPASSHYVHHSYKSPAISHSLSQSYTHSDGTGGWSLPRSSVRSMSRSSLSRSPSASASGSKSDDEDAPVEVDDNDMFTGSGRYGFGARGRIGGRYGWKRDDDDMSLGFSVQEEDEEEEDGRGGKETEEEEAWDGMDMDMVMD